MITSEFTDDKLTIATHVLCEDICLYWIFDSCLLNVISLCFYCSKLKTYRVCKRDEQVRRTNVTLFSGVSP